MYALAVFSKSTTAKHTVNIRGFCLTPPLPSLVRLVTKGKLLDFVMQLLFTGVILPSHVDQPINSAKALTDVRNRYKKYFRL